MRTYIGVIAMVTVITLACSSKMFCQSGEDNTGTTVHLNEVQSIDEATSFIYSACRDNSDRESDYKILNVTVREYRRVDLNGDGRLELVVTLDFHSTGGTAPVLVIFASETGTSCQQLKGYAPYGTTLDSAIVDLDNDGKKEIITVDWMLDYHQMTTQPIEWPVVNALLGTKYVPAEHRFIEYYRNLANRLKSEIRHYNQDNPQIDSETRERATLKWQLPMNKALRITGIDKLAGFEDAVKWSELPNIEWKKVAINVLGDIGSEDALKVLVNRAKGSGISNSTFGWRKTL